MSAESAESKQSDVAMPCVVCGPSGVGKGTLLNHMKELFVNRFAVAVSHTTRKPRPNEKNGIDYNFTSTKEFEIGIKNGDFIEYANVNGNYYGTSFNAIKDIENKNLICILEIDVVGAKIIKDSGKINANYLFITTKDGILTLKKRLMTRNTETQQEIEKRLATAEKELNFLNENNNFFGCVICNDNLQKSIENLRNQFQQWYPWIKIQPQIEMKEANDNNITSDACVVLSGPCGVGKGTLLRRVQQLIPDTFAIAVSHTTRKPRAGEKNGIDYNFINIKQFENGIKNGDFIEYANVNGNYYGTSMQSIRQQANRNLICILEIDVKGAKIIKESNKLNAKYLFITTNGGLDILKSRLMKRNTETQQQIDTRLKTAENTLNFFNQNSNFFDCVICNDELEASAQTLAQQFKTWYPWIISHNLNDEMNRNTANDDEKKTRDLMIEKQSLIVLFNALQFDGASIYDLRCENEYNKSHVAGAINICDVQSLRTITKLDNKRIFVYDRNGIAHDENKIKCINGLYDIAQKLNAIQFCVITDAFDAFNKLYPFLCESNSNEKMLMGKNRIRYPNCIINTERRIYVGGEIHAFDANVIKNLGITHIVNTKGTQSTLDENIAKTIQYFDIKIEDSENQSIINLFDKCSEFVHNALQQNNTNKVLIHCGGGKSRSTTFTMAYLMKYKKQSLAFAYGTVSNNRPKTYPNDGFINELANYEMKIHAKSTKHFIAKSKLRNKARWKKVLASWKI